MPVLPPALWLLLATLAVYRLAELVAFDEGFGGFGIMLREYAGAYDLNEATGLPETSAGRLVSCPYCLGVWLAFAGVTLFLLSDVLVVQIFLLWLGIAGGQSWLQSFSKRGL